MAMFALISGGGSPGVTTAALALALCWPDPVILAECDPAGGSVLAGLFGGHQPGGRGLLGLALATSRDSQAAAAELPRQLVAIDEGRDRLLLAGLADPREALGLRAAWDLIAAALAAAGQDVIADCGRLGPGCEAQASIIAAAAATVLVLRPTLRQVAAALPRASLAAGLTDGSGKIGLLLTGDARLPGYRRGEIESALGLPVIGALPFDPRTAAVLSDGAGSRSGLSGRPLLREATVVARAVRQLSAAGVVPPGWRSRTWPRQAEPAGGTR